VIKIFIKTLLVVLALMIPVAANAVAMDSSANKIMPGCRELLIDHKGQPPKESWYQPFCAGVIFTVREFSPSFGACVSDSVTGGQIIRVVVEYIDGRPARLHEEFTALAIEAVKAAWPCPR
jgi:hypothetical protein